MEKLDKYKTGRWATIKIDAGFVNMVRTYNEKTGLPMATIISEAIIRKMPKSILKDHEISE